MTTTSGAPRRRIERAMSLTGGKPLETFAAERHCNHPDCSVRLSRYNPNPTCATHGGWNEPKVVRRRG